MQNPVTTSSHASMGPCFFAPFDPCFGGKPTCPSLSPRAKKYVTGRVRNDHVETGPVFATFTYIC